MTISPPEREAKKVKLLFDRDPVETSFEKWAKPGISRVLAKVRQQQLGLESPR
jgi:photosystem I P700 chlorophyll a apoprotein A1